MLNCNMKLGLYTNLVKLLNHATVHYALLVSWRGHVGSNNRL